MQDRNIIKGIMGALKLEVHNHNRLMADLNLDALLDLMSDAEQDRLGRLIELRQSNRLMRWKFGTKY